MSANWRCTETLKICRIDPVHAAVFYYTDKNVRDDTKLAISCRENVILYTKEQTFPGSSSDISWEYMNILKDEDEPHKKS
jgi:hypothetical protein